MKIYKFLKKNGPAVWTKGSYARKVSGMCCLAKNVDAVSFCLLGLLNKFYGPKIMTEAEIALRNTIFTAEGHRSITEFNDSKSTVFEDVLEVVKKADV